MKVERIPLYAVDVTVLDKEQIPIGILDDKLHIKLEQFLESKFNFSSFINISYNLNEILISDNTLTSWTEDIHKEFSNIFPVILYSVKLTDYFTSEKQDYSVIYRYIPKFVNQNYNAKYSLDIRIILLKLNEILNNRIKELENVKNIHEEIS